MSGRDYRSSESYAERVARIRSERFPTVQAEQTEAMIDALEIEQNATPPQIDTTETDAPNAEDVPPAGGPQIAVRASGGPRTPNGGARRQGTIRKATARRPR